MDSAMPCRAGGAARPGSCRSGHGAINQLLIRHSDKFFGYERPTDFSIEERHPQLYPTNVRPETLAQDAAIKQQAAEGKTAQGAVSCALLRRSEALIPKTIW